MPEKKSNENKKQRSRKHEGDSEVCAAFREYARELDAKHDRRERLVKTSRDVTIESKRIIFLLHSLIKSEDRAAGLDMAEKRINALVEGPLRRAAKEGNGSREGWQPLSCCLQELAEALCLLHYMRHPTEHTLPNWKQLGKLLVDDTELMSEFLQMLTLCDFLLGVADYTGELMRQCINSVPLGELETCHTIKDIVQQLYTRFIGLCRIHNKDMSHKIYTLKCSTLKIELVCFDLKLRGSHTFLVREDYYSPTPRSTGKHHTDEEIIET